MDKNKDKDKTEEKELKIMEWRFNEILGEKLEIEDIKNNPDKECFLVTDVKFSPDGLYTIVSDKGGRLIIFRKRKTRNAIPKLVYLYEYAAYEKEFDRHTSCEYSEGVRAFNILENKNVNDIDILSAGFRNIKFDRVHNAKQRTFDTDIDHPTSSDSITVPKLKETKQEVKHKTKSEFKAHNSEIKSLSNNKHYVNNFISADEFKVFLWDLNSTKEVFNPIDLENANTEVIYYTLRLIYYSLILKKN